jgi:hypothetical protein
MFKHVPDMFVQVSIGTAISSVAKLNGIIGAGVSAWSQHYNAFKAYMERVCLKSR